MFQDGRLVLSMRFNAKQVEVQGVYSGATSDGYGENSKLSSVYRPASGHA